MEDPRSDICIGADKDLELLVELSNAVIANNKSLVDDYLNLPDRSEGFALIRQIMRDRMHEAPDAEAMYGKHRMAILVQVALMVLEISRVLNGQDVVDDATRLSLFYMLGWCRGILTFAHPKTTSLNGMQRAFHSFKCGNDRAHGHNRDNKRRFELMEPFLKCIKQELDAGYSGEWKMLYNRLMDTKKHPEFKGLSDAITVKILDDGRERRAFISKRKLQEEVKAIFKTYCEKK